MYVVWCTCAYCAYITFCTLSIYSMCVHFFVCSVEGVRGKASKMAERRLFSRSIPLGLDLTTKRRSFLHLLTRWVNDTPDAPPLDMWPVCMRAPSLSQTRPFQTPLYTSNVSPSCAIPQPPLIQPSRVPVSMPTQQPKMFCQQQLQLHLVLTLSLHNQFTFVAVPHVGMCLIHSPLWCWMPFYLKFL